MPNLRPAALGLAVSLAACLGFPGCSPGPADIAYPAGDLRPPGLLAAGPASSREVILRFDEAVRPVEGSFAAQPDSSLDPKAEGESLVVGFGSGQSAGADYSLVGEVEDLQGNRTRFLVRFTGWNDRAPALRLSEVLPCKNSSKATPHRDFVELEAMEAGNLGGVELSWASTVKAGSYRFPCAEVRKGDFVVVHLSPEGLPEERDECGADRAASGGVDATATGRDFWCGAMALPDASGGLSLAKRPGALPMDGLFYADDKKSGDLGKGELADLVISLARAGAWPLAGAAPAWSDGVGWSGSTSRSICRSKSSSSSGSGRASWYLGASGGQSPGAANGPADSGATKSLAASPTPPSGKISKAGSAAKAGKAGPSSKSGIKKKRAAKGGSGAPEPTGL